MQVLFSRSAKSHGEGMLLRNLRWIKIIRIAFMWVTRQKTDLKLTGTLIA